MTSKLLQVILSNIFLWRYLLDCRVTFSSISLSFFSGFSWLFDVSIVRSFSCELFCSPFIYWECWFFLDFFHFLFFQCLVSSVLLLFSVVFVSNFFFSSDFAISKFVSSCLSVFLSWKRYLFCCENWLINGFITCLFGAAGLSET